MKKIYTEPIIQFNDSLPTHLEFTKKLQKARSKSAPGPNGVPYVLYKRCPKTAKIKKHGQNLKKV